MNISVFKGKVGVNIREYYIDKNSGEERPSKKGVNLSLEQWDLVKQLIPKIDRGIQKMSPSTKANVAKPPPKKTATVPKKTAAKKSATKKSK